MHIIYILYTTIHSNYAIMGLILILTCLPHTNCTHLMLIGEVGSKEHLMCNSINVNKLDVGNRCVKNVLPCLPPRTSHRIWLWCDT